MKPCHCDDQSRSILPFVSDYDGGGLRSKGCLLPTSKERPLHQDGTAQIVVASKLRIFRVPTEYRRGFVFNWSTIHNSIEYRV